jgi:septal ring factor EnvC (AmiA/AmiB activator)
MKVQGFNYRLRILLPVVAMLLLCAPAQGQSKKQLERDKARIEKEIARLTGELGKARKNTRNSTKQIKLINQRIDERTRLIQNINSQMTLLDKQINRTEDSLRVVRGQIDSMKMEYAKVVRTLYGLRGNLNSTSLVFDNETYNYSYLKMKYFKEYARYRKHQATIIQRREQRFHDMDLSLQRQRNEKVSLLAQQRKQKDALAREQQKHQKNLDKSQQNERVLQQQLNKKEQQRARLQKQIQQLINAEVAKSTPKGSGTTSGKGSGSKASIPAYSDAASATFVQNKGRMAWPVHYKSIAREFGVYNHASGGQGRSDGIALNCSPGTTVYAVAAGTVASVFPAPNGSMGIVLRHGAYMTVYAGLGSVSVSAGSKVSARQALGTVYVSDEATSEFFFQLWCGSNPPQALNPRHWLN